MALVPDGAAAVLLALTVACVLVVVEVGLPTGGLAGGAALVVGGLGALALVGVDAPWWPLLLVAVAVGTWAAVLLAWLPTGPGQVAAALSFASGGVTYGALAEDVATVVLAALGAVLLPLGFRPLLRSTDRLIALEPQLGMESLLHRHATVVRWSGDRGTVRLDGSLWSATGADDLEPGAPVVVVATVGMTLEVTSQARSHP